MAESTEGDLDAPESWETADLDEAVTRLQLKDPREHDQLHEYAKNVGIEKRQQGGGVQADLLHREGLKNHQKCNFNISFGSEIESNGVPKVAIKQRPRIRSQLISGLSPDASKANSSRSVEERKEEYNRARARIFNTIHTSIDVKAATAERIMSPGVSNVNIVRESKEPSSSSSSSARTKKDKESFVRSRPNNRVAIFRDRELEKKDPDYDRNYERYMQRFDPGFGFNQGQYALQPLYTPAVNYNTEFPQLGSRGTQQLYPEPQNGPPRSFPKPVASPSPAAAMGYGHPDMNMSLYPPNHHVGPHATSAIYAQATQFPLQHVRTPSILPHEHIRTFSQVPHRPDANFSMSRPP